MNYGLNGTCDTTSNNGMNTGNEYFHNHHYHQHHTKSRSNDFHNSSKFNVHNQLDENENEQEQRIDNDYEIDDTDRPKLLMWGLTK
jgi:hypothetical protein